MAIFIGWKLLLQHCMDGWIGWVCGWIDVCMYMYVFTYVCVYGAPQVLYILLPVT